MEIKDSVALVTGSNRGIGEQFVKALLEAGVSKVYAGMRAQNSPPQWFSDRAADQIVTISLDITNPAEIKSAAEKCSDVNLLVNNAGVNFNSPLLADNDNARLEMETNYFGNLNMCRAFASVLKANGGGAIVNVLTILSRVCLPLMGSYCASKAACLSMTQGIRAELANQGTLVVAVMPGAADTRISKDFQGPKMDPRDIAVESLKGVIAGAEDVYPGEMAAGLAQGLSKDPKSVEKELAGFLPL